MITMKCYKTLFSKDGLIKNIGSYVLLFNIFIFLISIILFYKCGYNSLEDKMKEIYSSKNDNKVNTKIKENLHIKETSDIKENKIKKNIKKNSKKDKNNKKNKNKKDKEKKGKIIKKKSKKVKNKIINPLNLDANNKDKSCSKVELKINKFIVYTNKDDKRCKNIKKDKIPKKIINYNDYELNSFSYKTAILYDKRSCSAYYCSLIKYKHPIIFHLCILNDYNSMIIKIDLFCLSLSFYYFINTLFFDENTIHKIYEDQGIYNFIYLAPFISFSFIISHTLSLISKYIFLSERNLYEIKREENIENVYDKWKRLKNVLL